MSAQPASPPASGATAAEEPLGIRMLLRMALRGLRFVPTIRRDLRWLIPLLLVVIVVFVPISMMLSGAFFEGLLRGNDISGAQARLLGLPRELFVDVGKLSVEARELLRGRLIGLGAVVLVLAVLLAFRVISWGIAFVQRINNQLRVAMMAQVQAMSLRFHAGSRVGDTIYRTFQDSSTIATLLTLLVRPLYPLGLATYSVLVSALLHPALPILLLVTYAGAFLLGRAFTPMLRSSFQHAREENSALTSQIQETMAAIKVVKAFGAEASELARFERTSHRAFAAAFDARSKLALYTVVAFVLTVIPALFMSCYLAVLAAREHPIGTMLAFAGFTVWNLASYTYGTARMTNGTTSSQLLLTQWGSAQDLGVAMRRALHNVDLQPEVVTAPDAVPLTTLERDITWNGVSFGYDPSHPVLHDVSLRAEVSKITALVGPTGSGKTTLVSLLLRLFDPDRGSIAIDGRDLRALTVDSVRSQIAIALQEHQLFGTTIAENIRYAVPDASDEAVRKAAQVACASEFIEHLPLGYETPLGERGAKLSTGQRQRLSIARAVIKDAPILILDEPTAALDAETELQVLESLARWGQGRAIFLVTHRLSTIRRADQIVYLHEGRVLEHGSHDSLMRDQSGAYRRFVEQELAGGSKGALS